MNKNENKQLGAKGGGVNLLQEGAKGGGGVGGGLFQCPPRNIPSNWVFAFSVRNLSHP